jgi:hypothetical protein
MRISSVFIGLSGVVAEISNVFDTMIIACDLIMTRQGCNASSIFSLHVGGCLAFSTA